ncbi:hypothetical protein [Mycolicibacterium smegmatis]|uniref:Uncharacterized protein n=3 Tax=Mycolicibacterium smegmatis TaxID=1772 RepID=A0QX49_MYCS2|nr:hypothetical protein [Mycolicibacterium smegmatis]ABK71643.1 conserved hypothetical protein [Mycolicibacterium smegmatis MC2 155]AFP39554.1 hypothetical protein MSMEI_3090 [Mycolicibacterium smegmatis MC2 155]AIU08324.1 hypothetical protein LJ00_15770 [Mycolicibacterium smegmatis MC2 155]AIU14949.1 hypothetical protein LI99_15775 [Mycolicibacterium smegmatis]AIU21572.1 hypothetical protein LI98_15780 [Mycolicibacterium smegmatis]
MLHRFAILAAVGVLGVGLILAGGVAGAPSALAEPPPGTDAIDSYPLAEGNFTSPTDFYHVFFKTPDGRHCGIGPNGGPIGCDAVPADAPPGTNQTVVEYGGTPAVYRFSENPTFTRDVDVLPEGHRLTNWGATCGVGYQGTVTCRGYGGHGFVLAANYGVLW